MSLPKLLFDTFDAAPLRRRMLSTALAAEKAAPQSAKEILTAHSEATCERARRCPPDQIRPPRQVGNRHSDGGVRLLWGAALFVWWQATEVQSALSSAVIAGTVTVLSWLNMVAQPRLKTVRVNRKLFAELGCPKELRLLAIPGFRDYMRSLTISPELARMAARKLEENRAPDFEETAPDQVTYVNSAIDFLEKKYRHPVRPR